MSNVKNYYVVYADETGIVGLFTAKKRAEDAAGSVPGSVLHVLPVGLLDQTVTVTDYSPPSPPVLSYGSVSAAIEAMPDLEDLELQQRAAELEDYYYENVEEPVSTSTLLAVQTPQEPKVQTAKDKILAKLAAELGVEDENNDDVFTPEVVVQQPTGGQSKISPTGLAGNGVEFFSPL